MSEQQRVAIVTGAAGGICRDLVLALHRVSDADPVAIYQPALRAGVGKPAGEEPAVTLRRAVCSDLTAGRCARVRRLALG